MRPQLQFTTDDPRPQRIDWKWIADELRQHPGEWTHVEMPNNHYARNYASRIRKGKLTAFEPAGEFESYTIGKVIHVSYRGPQ